MSEDNRAQQESEEQANREQAQRNIELRGEALGETLHVIDPSLSPKPVREIEPWKVELVQAFADNDSVQLLAVYEQTAHRAADLKGELLAKEEETSNFEEHVAINLQERIAQGKNAEQRKALLQQFLYAEETEDGSSLYGVLKQERADLRNALAHAEARKGTADRAIKLLSAYV